MRIAQVTFIETTIEMIYFFKLKTKIGYMIYT